jgi:hypothetical protein
VKRDKIESRGHKIRFAASAKGNGRGEQAAVIGK